MNWEYYNTYNPTPVGTKQILPATSPQTGLLHRALVGHPCFASKVALVTGAGRGIGRAIAQQLAAAGASVMLNDLDRGPLEEARSTVAGSRILAGDMTDPAFPQQLVDRTIEELGGLDIIVNNAGYTWDGVIQKVSDEQFQAMLDIHIVAPFRILRAAAALHAGIRRSGRRRKGGAYIAKWSISHSIAATDGGAGQAWGIHPGKAAVIGLTRTMATEETGGGTAERQRSGVRTDRDPADSTADG